MQPSSARCQCHIQDLGRDEPWRTRAWQRCATHAVTISSASVTLVPLQYTPISDKPTELLSIAWKYTAIPCTTGDTIHPSGRALSLEIRPGRVDKRDSLVFLEGNLSHCTRGKFSSFFFNTNPLCRHSSSKISSSSSSFPHLVSTTQGRHPRCLLAIATQRGVQERKVDSRRAMRTCRP